MRPLAILTAALLASLASKMPEAAADGPPAGNSVFRVVVEDVANRDGIGTFTVLTGPDHPAGEGLPVLFSGSSGAGSSTIAVRSYTTGTDYVQTTTGAGSGNLVARLDGAGVSEAAGNTGYRTTYDLASIVAIPDDLTIVTSIEVTGAGAAGSAVEIVTSLQNEGDVPLQLGVRYLLDFAPGGDDGPTFRVGSTGNATGSEASLSPPPSSISLSPNRPSVPSVDTDVAADGPAADLIDFVSWPHAFPFAFDYTPAGRDVASESSLNDSAVLVYFGASKAGALTIAPNETVRVAVRLSVSASPDPTPEAPSATPPLAPATQTPLRPLSPVELPRTGNSPMRGR